MQLMPLCAKQRKMQRYEGSRPRRLRRAAAGSPTHSLSIVLRYSLNRHSHNFKPSAQLAHELDSSASTQFVTLSERLRISPGEGRKRWAVRHCPSHLCLKWSDSRWLIGSFCAAVTAAGRQ